MSSRKWAKKPLVLSVALCAVVLLCALVPVFFEAQAFSFSSAISATVASANASIHSFNSQTIPLLAAAANIDPNPLKGEGDLTVVGGSALAPQAGPSGTAADIEEWPTTSQISVYTVRAGDTLSEIAAMFGVSNNTIVWANDLKGGIHEGQQLIILPVVGLRHTVTKGETLASVAKTFKADAGDIAQFNGLDAHAALAVGQSIIIPNGEMPAQNPTPGKTKTTTGKHGRITKAPAEPYRGGSGPDYGNYYAWPIDGGVITQGLHGWNAIDIGASSGTHILAAADGTVIIAKMGGWNGGYGNYVVIAHPNGTQTLYSHASKLLVSAGQPVSQGQAIALVGQTGLATGPHLHFEVRGAKNPFASLSVGDSQ